MPPLGSHAPLCLPSLALTPLGCHCLEMGLPAHLPYTGLGAGPKAVFITVSPAPSSKAQVHHSAPISHVTRPHSKLRARIETHIFLMAKPPLNLEVKDWKNVDSH